MHKLILMLAMATFPARADLVMMEDLMMGRKVESRITTSISGHKARIDYGDRQSAIFDLKTGEFVSLIHGHKLFSRIGGRDNLALLAESEKTNPLPKAGSNGKKEAVDGSVCEILVYKSSGASVRLWVAREHPSYAKWKASLAMLRKLSREPVVDGMILKSETRNTFSQESTRVVSIREVDVPGSTFIVPAGYQKQDP